MTEQQTGNQQESEATGASDSAGKADDTGATTGREWMNQLQSMIDNVATQAAPVMRDVAAKAAELAATAGEKAGPIARRAADATAEAGAKLAERGRVVAADLRRDAAAARETVDGHDAGGADSTAAANVQEGADAGASGAAGEPPGGADDDAPRSA